ncbi:MAG: type II CRISPR RNA-guided endonuclease Cas9 [Gammaproteobacteria bacterium]|nr:type II CRISPR RNA-guided endonuclease Cas9 [Gammaproteobacteria bacterium]
MKYRLGLDIGTNSIGWSVLATNEQQEVVEIVDAGARIFSDGRTDKSKSTLAADRRVARGARRRRDRFLQRQSFLLQSLSAAGLFPKDQEERKELQLENPLQPRARALTEKLQPFQIGRALFHINQRRGFKSNRKDKSEEATSGKVVNSVKLLAQEMGLCEAEEQEESSREWLEKLQSQKQLSYGQFLWERQQQHKPTRARSGYGEKGDLYEVYPTREIYIDEFNKIWDAQATFYPEMMTKECRKNIYDIIFFQRPLKAPELGQCLYLSKEKRTYRAMPSFQQFRIYQEVNHLEWRDGNHDKYQVRNNKKLRDQIVSILEKQAHKKSPAKPSVRNAEVNFRVIKKILAKNEIAENTIVFNYESEKRNGLDANLTSHIMQHLDYVGQQWHEWDLQKQDKFIEEILGNEKEDEEVHIILQQQYGLSQQAADTCMQAQLIEGTASVSLKAARLVLEKLRDGVVDEEGEIRIVTQDKAVQFLADEIDEFVNPMQQKNEDGEEYKLAKQLPYYGELFEDRRHIIPGQRREIDKKKKDDLNYFGGVTNPTVHIALNQIRKVVNELIARYQHPDSIAIELGRDLPEGAGYRAYIETSQKKNQDNNREWGDKLIELGVDNNAANRLRLKLWNQQKKLCPYSGKKIECSELFSAEIEVDHIIPFSMSLDDNAANKVVCTRQANRDKGNRTPWEAFHDNPNYIWRDILSRAGDIAVKSNQYSRHKKKFEDKEFNNKLWRFQENVIEKWQEEYGNDFLARHLNDTRYIGRLTREYLECICHSNKINVVTGKVTSLLRKHWGLNSILQTADEITKNREDYRHHAVDAIVIGMINRSMLQKISTKANQGEELQINFIFSKNEDGTSVIDPWVDFRADVKKVINNIYVSHRTNHKKQGQLHKETAYGIADQQKRQKLNQAEVDQAVSTSVVFRKGIEEFTERKQVMEIRDKLLQQEFLQYFDAAVEQGGKGVDGIKALAQEKNIRHLRVQVNRTVQPIRNKEKEIYKAYELRNNWAMEIYQPHDLPDNWYWTVISKYEAIQKNFQPGVTKRKQPTDKLVMRIFNEDMLKITDKNGETRVMRVHKMSEGDLCICEHQLANIAKRLKQLVDNQLCYRCTSVGAFKKLQPQKIHISPTGRIRHAKQKHAQQDCTGGSYLLQNLKEIRIA